MDELPLVETAVVEDALAEAVEEDGAPAQGVLCVKKASSEEVPAGMRK